ncbi:unnamed protein product [Peniophora sp. CBMAI 1063]|nr:unnamed protein product [Peniophora sp. CBMAI 1063]
MTLPSSQRDVFDETQTAQQEGDSFWRVFLDTCEEEIKDWLQTSASAMGNAIAYSSLFAAAVATFLNDLYQNLNANTNSTETTVNILWLLALVYSIIAALLASMVQDWLARALKSNTRPKTQTIERFAQARLTAYAKLSHYRLDSLGTFILGLMQVAVILFLIGLCLRIYLLNSLVGKVLIANCGFAGLLFIVASILPLFNPGSPYTLPISHVLTAVVYGLATIMASLSLFGIIICIAISSWVKERRFHIRDLDPRPIQGCFEDPTVSVQILRILCGAVIHRRSFEEVKKMIQHVSKPAHAARFISGRRLAFLLERMHGVLFKTPAYLRYAARRWLNLELDGVSDFLVNIRANRASMRSVTEALQHEVNSVHAAEGSIRLLQLLVLADTAVDNLTQAHSNQDERWKYFRMIIGVLPAFAACVGELNTDALDRRDISLHTAIASFRWALIVAMGHIERRDGDPAGTKARDIIRTIFVELAAVEGLKLQRVSSEDHESLDELFGDARDPRLEQAARLELAARNAFTLLVGVGQCNWERGVWQKPDARYIPEGGLGMWDWHHLLVETELRRRSASDELQEFLTQEHVRDLVRAGSDPILFATLKLDPIAVDAVRNLAKVVDIPGTTMDRSDSRIEFQDIPQVGPTGTSKVSVVYGIQEGSVEGGTDESGPLIHAGSSTAD